MTADPASRDRTLRAGTPEPRDADGTAPGTVAVDEG